MGTPNSRSTSVLLVEEIHDALEILRREPRVDRRLDVGVTQMFLHRAKISAGALEQLHGARVTERVWMDGVHADALAEVLDGRVAVSTQNQALGALLSSIAMSSSLTCRGSLASCERSAQSAYPRS